RRRSFGHRHGAKLAGAKAAHEFVAGEETRGVWSFAAVAARGIENRAKSPRVRRGEKRIAKNARSFAGRTKHVFVAAKKTAGGGVRKGNMFVAGVVRPSSCERTVGSVSLKIDGLHGSCVGRSTRAKLLIRCASRKRVVDAERIGVGDRVGPRHTDTQAARSGERTLDAVDEAGPNHIVENRKRKRAACEEDSLLGYAQKQLHTLGASFEFRGEQLFVVQEIENRISKAEGAAELGAAAVEVTSLLADFLQMDGDVRGAACIVELDVNVFFAHGFEITGSGQLREANFEGALVEWVAFAQGNSAADEAITKSVQTLELEAV